MIGCRFLLVLNLRFHTFFQRLKIPTTSIIFLIWLHLAFLQNILDAPTRFSSSCLLSADLFLLLYYLPFGTLFHSIFVPHIYRFIICFPWFFLTQDIFISRVSSAIVIDSLHTVSLDFDLRTSIWPRSYCKHAMPPRCWICCNSSAYMAD